MFSKDKTIVGIVGTGYVGGAVNYWFEKQLFRTVLYDKHKEIGSLQDINRADIVFLCLPTPFVSDNNKGFDDTAIWDVLKNIEGQKIIVIKSTVLPGSTEKYQKQFSRHKFLMNPEFLTAKTAIQDLLKPQRQIVGYTEAAKDVAEDILNILPDAPFKRIVKSKEAEMIKYFGNVFLAVRVAFANQAYDVCQKAGIDYEAVKECAGADPRIGYSHLDIFHDGYRGYSGACLPKDINAFIQFFEKTGVNPKLFKVVEEINNELINGNNDEKK